MADDEVAVEDVTAEKTAVTESLEKAGDNSYYKWSRERQQEEISDDIRRGGEGIADGGGVKKLEVTKAVTKDEVDVWIEDLAWNDEGEKVKLYIDFPESIAGAKIDCEFRDYGVTLVVKVPNSKAYGFRVEPDNHWILEPERSNGFHGKIVPDKCKYRVSSSNKKITLTVQKVDTHDGWHQLRKKLPKFHK
jgi:hypothetical protein